MSDINTDNVQHSVCKNGIFQNPWPTWSAPKFLDLIHFVTWDKDKSKIPSQQVNFDIEFSPERKFHKSCCRVGIGQNFANTKTNI